jgi:lysophospholipase L1-like esterase
VAACYAEVVRRIREAVPGVRVYIVTCHATRGLHEKTAPFIAPYNAALKRIAESAGPGVRFVNHFDDTVGSDGLLKSELTSDGLHLNAAGRRILADKIIEALKADGLKPQTGDK